MMRTDQSDGTVQVRPAKCIIEELSQIFNTLAEVGEYPKEMAVGSTCAITKTWDGDRYELPYSLLNIRPIISVQCKILVVSFLYIII